MNLQRALGDFFCAVFHTLMKKLNIIIQCIGNILLSQDLFITGLNLTMNTSSDWTGNE